MKSLYFTLFLFILLLGCRNYQPNEGREAVVEVEGNFLFKDEVQKLIPVDVNVVDSANIVDNYIRNWAINILLYENAKRNIGDLSQINQLVEEYRRTLIIHEYEQKLVSERIGSSVSEHTLKEFYEDYKQQIKLEESIIKGIFIIAPIDAPDLDKLRIWMRKADAKSIENIEKYSLQNAISYDFFINNWTPFYEINKKAPFQFENTNQSLQSSNFFEATDSTRTYLLHVKNRAFEGEIAPYDYSKEIITTIILNKKKTDFLINFENTLYNDALKKGNINYLNNNK